MHRSKDNKMIAGVCAGLSESMKIDPSITRLIVLLLLLFSGFSETILLIYLILWIILPKQ